MEDVHCVEYIARTELFISDDGDFYSIAYELNNDRMPYTLSGDFPNDDSFTAYVKKNLNARIHNIKYVKVKMLDNVNNDSCTTTKK